MKIQRVNFGHSENPMFEEHLEFNKIIPHSVRKKSFPSNEVVPMHYADTLEILIAENLLGEISIDNFHYFNPNRLVFVIPPNTIHSTNLQKCDGYLYTIKIPFKPLSYYVDVLHLLEFVHCDLSTLPYVNPEFDRMRQLANNLMEEDDNIFARMRHIISITEILSTAKHTDSHEADMKKYDNSVIDLHQIITWTRSNYKKKITLEEAAEKAGYSKYYFCSQFKKSTGMTYFEYLNQVRIAQAKLLLNTHDFITFVSYECGFESSSYFSLVFKKLTGLTPKAYRDACRLSK